MGKPKTPDTPWHTTYLRMSSNDSRRHKSRCVYYKNNKCYCETLVWCGKKCRGSSQCMKYKERQLMAKP